jgi:transposase
MLWIIGSMALVLFGTVLMCTLIVGRWADDRMELAKLIEPSIRLPFSAEDKTRVVLEGFHNQIPVSDLCKREGISPVLYYSWVNDFIDAGKTRLNGDSLRNATQSRVQEVEGENVVLNWLGV